MGDGRAFDLWQAGDSYLWRCRICGDGDGDWEDLESCSHVAEMHVAEEHADV